MGEVKNETLPTADDTQRPLLIDQKLPLESTQIPPELTQMLNTTFDEISQKLLLQGINPEDIPTRPVIYLCSRNDMETINRLSGQKPLPPHRSLGALYFMLSHEIFFTMEYIDGLNNPEKLTEFKEKVYEEMIHALTTRYDEVEQTIKIGFNNPKKVTSKTMSKIKAARSPKGTFNFYDWSIVQAGLPPHIDFSEDKGAVYSEDDAFTENTTHLICYLLTNDASAEVGTDQFIGDPKEPKIKVTASAKCKQYRDEYAKRTSGRDITSDLLKALFLGDPLLMDKIADSYYALPSSPQNVAASAFRFITSRNDKVAFQLRTAILELKNPRTTVFSVPQEIPKINVHP